MQTHDNTTLFSPTDLVTFLGCAHATALDLAHLAGGGRARDNEDEDEYLRLLSEKGIAHERAQLDAYRSAGKRITEVSDKGPLDERVALTRRAMAEGADVIYQGALHNGSWRGYSDFLLRVDGTPSRFGTYSYDVADTKLSTTARPKYVVQLYIYSQLLAVEQGVFPSHAHVILGDGETATVRIADFMDYCKLAADRVERFVATGAQATTAEPCSHCAMCRWKAQCEAEWERIDHPSLVAGVSRGQIKKLRSAGVATMAALGALGDDVAVAKVQPATLARLRQQARLQVAKRTDGQNRVETLPLAEGKGFGRLPRPNDGDLFFDMEGNPLQEGGLEYLFGFDYLKDGVPGFKAFWAHDSAEEKRAFERAIDFIVGQLAKHPDAHVYHYASYEQSAFARLSDKHNTRLSEVDDLLRQRKLVDLYKVVREGVRVSEPSYSLKNVEVFYGADRGGEGEVKSGGESIVVYERWRHTREQALLDQIERYNAVDCRSTRQCRDWLLSLRPGEAKWFVGVEPDGKEDERSEAREEVEAHIATVRAALVDQAPVEDEPFHALLADLLDYHRREARPAWWDHFDRVGKTTDQLIEDASCLGDLSPDPTRRDEPDKRSFIRTYRFPAQESKIDVGDDVYRAGTGKPCGKVVELDEDAGRIRLRMGPSVAALAAGESLIPAPPIDDKVLRAAIERVAAAVMAGEGGRYRAVLDILRQSPPRVTGVRAGAPVMSGKGDPLTAAVGTIIRLDQSYVLVQGPPGTGKTFTSAHAIVELLNTGKRVAISSNSHKAINNLLHAVERVARERKASFRGVKKTGGVGQEFVGLGLIEDVKDLKDPADAGAQLVAGTAWALASQGLDQAFDHLFIDEAGQVPLANVVAMGTCARNIVLVGDQMQLAHPTRANHPDGSGASALEHLLGDLATVPADRGIFLGVTRRLHPDLCRFVSDAFYDGRLTPSEETDRQRLVLPDGLTATGLTPAGLRFVGVEHDACRQESEEEAEAVRSAFDQLLGCRWIDHDGVERAMTVNDVLVVTPFNMQVRLIRSSLPVGARVGTVDRFQGQEAAAVLVSMTSSSGEDIPRGLDFLFSRNRLNVAISRARCLSVVFASPRLLEVPCRTIEQMRLVNTLCAVHSFSAGSGERLRLVPTQALLLRG